LRVFVREMELADRMACYDRLLGKYPHLEASLAAISSAIVTSSDTEDRQRRVSNHQNNFRIIGSALILLSLGIFIGMRFNDPKVDLAASEAVVPVVTQPVTDRSEFGEKGFPDAEPVAEKVEPTPTPVAQQGAPNSRNAQANVVNSEKRATVRAKPADYQTYQELVLESRYDPQTARQKMLNLLRTVPRNSDLAAKIRNYVGSTSH
jgi:hypothetical protein